MNKRQFQYKLLKLMSGPFDDEFLTFMMDELIANYNIGLLEEINEKILDGKLTRKNNGH